MRQLVFKKVDSSNYVAVVESFTFKKSYSDGIVTGSARFSIFKNEGKWFGVLRVFDNEQSILLEDSDYRAETMSSLVAKFNKMYMEQIKNKYVLIYF